MSAETHNIPQKRNIPIAIEISDSNICFNLKVNVLSSINGVGFLSPKESRTSAFS